MTYQRGFVQHRESSGSTYINNTLPLLFGNKMTACRAEHRLYVESHDFGGTTDGHHRPMSVSYVLWMPASKIQHDLITPR